MPIALVATAIAAVLAAAGTLTGARDGEPASWGLYPLDLAIIGIGAVGVFGVVVRRALSRESAARTALALALLGALTLVVFWTSLPLFFGTAAVLLGIGGPRVRRQRATSTLAATIGILVLVGYAVSYATDLV